MADLLQSPAAMPENAMPISPLVLSGGKSSIGISPPKSGMKGGSRIPFAPSLSGSNSALRSREMLVDRTNQE